ncbi:MAG: trans-aconitate 2-methyltransferase [Ancalomicrobiaceae bacterium]|nr:trans-aconitate 2-methyltransferase [Ancalomicrobiaceae bacterium]
MTNDWNPALYDRFGDERERPSRDLLARVPLADATLVVDLGCGSGLSTRPLIERFAGAKVIGVDSSPAMLEKARKTVPGASYELGDVAAWEPPVPADLVFANAVLQWLPDHEDLMPRLVSRLRLGGVLAIQMPDNLGEPSHRCMVAAAEAGPWAAKLGSAAGARTELLSIVDTYDLLAPVCRHVDIWTTTYQHPLDGHQAIVDWFRSTGLRPYLDLLDDAEKIGFLDAYLARLDTSYVLQRDGKVLLAFPRRFIVAVR